jgi:hypothetical protein
MLALRNQSMIMVSADLGMSVIGGEYGTGKRRAQA